MVGYGPFKNCEAWTDLGKFCTPFCEFGVYADGVKILIGQTFKLFKFRMNAS